MVVRGKGVVEVTDRVKEGGVVTRGFQGYPIWGGNTTRPQTELGRGCHAVGDRLACYYYDIVTNYKNS